VRASARRLLAVALVSGSLVGVDLAARPPDAADRARAAPPLPKDPARWVGAPATLRDPGKRVTLVFVWTFG
jgi:hypothetical protein